MTRKPHGIDQEAAPPNEPGEDEAQAGQAATGETAEAGDPRESPAAEVDYRDRWLRTEADFQNFRRRAQRDLEEAVRFAEDRLLLDTIAQLDDLERALEAAGESTDAWIEGVRIVVGRMQRDLERHGVTRMETLGAPFDPELHEALLEIDAAEGQEPGTVAQVVRSGWQRQGRALRAARVVVARPPEGA